MLSPFLRRQGETHESKETYIYRKRPVYIKWDLHTKKTKKTSEETSNRDIKVTPKRDLPTFRTYLLHLYLSKETCRQTGSAKETHELALSRHVRWRNACFIKRDLHTWKETYTHQKRPTHSNSLGMCVGGMHVSGSMQWVAVCYSVLQWVAVCYSVLQWVAVCYSV